MADFGNLTGRKRPRSEGRAVKFAARIQRLVDRLPPLVTLIGSRGAEATIKSVSRFLASFGSETARLNATSKRRLTEQTSAERNKLITRAVEEIQAITRRELTSALERYARGRIDIEGLRAAMQQTLRRQTLAAAIVGVGGVGNLTENVLTATRRALTQQFNLLDGFINDLDVSGRTPTERDFNRARLYANPAHSIAQTAARQFFLDKMGDEGEVEERRILGGAEHCEDCLVYASEGWQPAGTLPPPGQGSVCGESCRCTMESRQGDSDYSSNQVQDRQNPVPEG